MTAAALDAPVAGLLRRLADALPAMGGYTGEDADTLRRLAEEQQQRAEYDAMMRAEVEAARAEAGPGYTTQEVREYVRARLREKYGHRQAQAV
ncbi:MAG: hypothetical protein IJM64_01775 [Ottowia sp.]|nr:hypothetical protein [Ottowia sp.]